MKYFEDGDQLCITLDDFVDLQESPAYFVPLDSRMAQIILKEGFSWLPLCDLLLIRSELGVT